MLANTGRKPSIGVSVIASICFPPFTHSVNIISQKNKFTTAYLYTSRFYPLGKLVLKLALKIMVFKIQKTV